MVTIRDKNLTFRQLKDALNKLDEKHLDNHVTCYVNDLVTIFHVVFDTSFPNPYFYVTEEWKSFNAKN